MLTKDQANAASNLLLADGRTKQREHASTIATQYRPLATYLRYSVTSLTGFLAGGIFGDQLLDAFFPWCVAGLFCGIGYGYFLGLMRRRREA